jgi:predicted MarR family transcription regulator
MEIRMVLFLACVSVVLISNTVVLLVAYKFFSRLTGRLTAAAAEFSKSGLARKWVDSLQPVAERAATVTESTKLKLAELDPVLARTQEKHGRILADADAKFAKTADDIEEAARTIRDAVAKPAFAVVSFTAGVRKVIDER